MNCHTNFACKITRKNYSHVIKYTIFHLYLTNCKKYYEIINITKVQTKKHGPKYFHQGLKIRFHSDFSFISYPSLADDLCFVELVHCWLWHNHCRAKPFQIRSQTNTQQTGTRKWKIYILQNSEKKPLK